MAPFLLSRDSDAHWDGPSYREAVDMVRRLACFLIAQGIEPGDRVVLAAENRMEWVLADLAIMAAGAWVVPAYATNTAKEHAYIIANSEAKMVIVGDKEILEKVTAGIRSLATCTVERIIAIDGAGDEGLVPISHWDEAVSAAPDQSDALDRRIAGLERDDLACIIYTSGTSSEPKGVMTTHGAILANTESCRHLIFSTGLSKAEGEDSCLSILPMSHAYEHTVGLHFMISIAASIFINDRIDQVVSRIAEVRPTLIILVPRLYEVVYQRITTQLQRKSALQRKLFDWTLRLGRLRYIKGELDAVRGLLDAGLDWLVRRKILAIFGGRVKAIISGGAALSPEIGEFFLALGLPMLQGYGLTESGPVSHCNVPGLIRIDTVGTPLPWVEQRIAEDGEILLRGESIMAGYWRDDAATRAAIDDDGWLHTGDIGRIDAGEYLSIIDRKKDIIVLSGGDNVSPARIEGILAMQPEIAQAMVFGNRRNHLAALLIPDADWLDGWCENAGKVDKTLAEWAVDGDLCHEMDMVLNRVNGKLSVVERIRGYVIGPERFEVGNGLLTPSQKLKRHIARDRFAEILATLG